MAKQGSYPIWYATMLDNAGLKQGEAEAQRIWQNMQRDAANAGSGVEKIWQKAGAAVAGYLSIQAIGQFARQMVAVRGQFQQLEIAFGTMLKSGDKAKKLMSDLSEFAATTPFGLQSSASAAKQLLAYGSSAETLIGEMRMLGDVAAGTSQPIGDLVYLYGTLRTQGRAYMMDIRQFAGRGIPIYDELAKVLGVSKDRVNEFVSAGKVGFAEVEQAFKNMTSSGGMYGGLMEAQSKSVTGRIEQLKDAVDIMFNEMGKASEGAIYSAISGAASLVENYEKVGKILLEIAATYGVYKAALIAVNFAQAQKLVFDKLVAEQMIIESALRKGATADMIREAATTKALAIAKQRLVANLKTLAKSLVPNPYVLAAAAVAALAFGIYKLITYQTDAEKAQSRLNKAMGEADAASAQEISSLARLKGELSAAAKGTDEYNKIKDKIVSGYGKYHDGLAEEIEKVGLLDSTYQSLTKSIQASFGARQYEQFMKSEMENLDNVMSENLTKIQDRLAKKLGDEKGAAVYSKILSGVIEGSITANILSGIKGLDDETTKLLDNVAGVEGGAFDFTNRKVERLVIEIQKAQKLTDEIDKKARERFGITGDAAVSDTSTPTSADTTTPSIDKDTENRLKKQAKELAELRAKLEADAAQAHIDAMREGYAKQRLARDLEFNEELDQIEKEYARIAELQGKSINLSNISDNQENRSRMLVAGLTEEDVDQFFATREEKYRNYFNDIQKLSSDRVEKEKSDWNEYLIEFGTYEEKRLGIEKKYADLIAKATTEGEKKMLEGEKGRALSDLENDMIQNSEAWKKLFGDLGDLSSKTVSSLIDKVKEMVNSSTELSIEDINILLGKLREAEKELESRNPFKSLKEAAKAYKKASEENNPDDQVKAANKMVASFGQVRDYASGIGSSISGILDTFGLELPQEVTAYLAGMDKALEGLEGINLAEPMSIITGAFKVLEGLSMQVAGVFGSTFEKRNAALQREIEYNRALVDVYDQLIDRQEKLIAGLSGKDATDAYDEGAKFIEAQKEAAQTALIAFFDSSAKKYGHSQGHYFDKEFGFDFKESLYDMSGDEWRKFIEENAETWARLPENVREYAETIMNADEAMEELGKSTQEALTGLSFDALKNGLDELITSSDLAFQDIQDSFEDHMGNAILNVVKKKLVEEGLKKWYDDFATAMDDDTLSESEANDLRAKYEQIVREGKAKYDAAMQDAGIEREIAENSREATAQGFAQASQDSVNQGIGILTNMEDNLFETRGAVLDIRGIMQTNQKIQQANTDAMLGHLSAIRSNTARLEAVENHLLSLNRATEDMRDGIDALNR